MLLVLTYFGKQCRISSALPTSIFLQGVNRYLVTWRRRFTPKSQKYFKVLYHTGPGTLTDQEWQKNLLVLNYLDTPNRFSWKQRFLFRLSGSEVTVTSFRMLPRGNEKWFCPIAWNLDKLNMNKGWNNFVSMPNFRMNNLYSNWLQFFRQSLHRDAHGQFWLMCRRDLLFLQPVVYPPQWRKNQVQLRLWSKDCSTSGFFQVFHYKRGFSWKTKLYKKVFFEVTSRLTSFLENVIYFFQNELSQKTAILFFTWTFFTFNFNWFFRNYPSSEKIWNLNKNISSKLLCKTSAKLTFHKVTTSGKPLESSSGIFWLQGCSDSKSSFQYHFCFMNCWNCQVSQIFCKKYKKNV